MDSPDPDFDRALRARYPRLAGVDEVGRGPWAGPVTACAVILEPGRVPQGLRDSKTLSHARREALAAQILAVGQVAVVHVDVDEIDRTNILAASMTAMARALARLEPAPDLALIDGNRVPEDLPFAARAVVRGDATSEVVAAASIVAKVTRDRLMVALSQQFPGYGWHSNAGYGTAAHRAGLEKHGVTPHHRRSFKPVHNILCAPKMPKS
ncbi:MAG: ribonuclease HII [Pseudomonadota bacterium]